jgi:hypothetical protein
MALPMDGSGDAFPVVKTPFIEMRPRFSPDGRWIAYQSDESGRSEIYVRQFPGPGGRLQVSTSGGSEPWWSADGREIFYLDEEENIVSVAVRAADVFTAALPEVLFKARLCQSGQRNRYLVASDGQRFLMVSPVESQTIPPMTVVLNWDAALARCPDAALAEGRVSPSFRPRRSSRDTPRYPSGTTQPSHSRAETRS